MPKVSGPQYFLGIDPGQFGGMAVLNRAGSVVYVEDMPKTESDICHSIWSFTYPTRVFCLIEKVHSMPGQGVSSTFKFGVGYGGLRMVLVARGIPFDEVTPQTWQKGLGIPKKKMETESKTQWKNRLKAKAQQLFPSIEVTLGISDALLISEFCRRRELGLL